MACGYETVVVQEAGLDGFAIHRLLLANGIESHVVDAASIAVARRHHACAAGGQVTSRGRKRPQAGAAASLRRPSVNATLNLKDARTIHRPIGALKNSRMTRGGAPSRNGRGSIVCERRAVMQTASREPKASAEKNAVSAAGSQRTGSRSAEIERDPVHARDRQPEEEAALLDLARGARRRRPCANPARRRPRGQRTPREITVTLTSIPYSLCESVLQRLSPKLGDRLEVAIEASVTVISPEHRCAQKSTFRKVSTARRGGKEFVNPQATSGGCLQYEFRFRAESAGTRIASGRTGVPFLPYRSRFEVTPCVPPCAPVALLRGGGINGSRLEQCAQALGVGFASLFSRGDNSA